MKKKELLIVNQTQFGYHSGNLQYCKYLKDDYKISFFCWDYNKKKHIEPDINVNYISRKGNIIIRNIRFIRNLLKLLKNKKFHFTYIQYFIGASIIPICNFKNKQKLHLDIRTGTVSTNGLTRNISDILLSLESFFFKSNSIISAGLRKKLRISKKALILPLGANPIFVAKEVLPKMHLLYVGILTNRKIEDTIYGVSIFLEKYPTADFHYTIVGDGWFDELSKLQKLVNKLNLQSHIDLVGYVPADELIEYYKKVNVGISYIPITPYYEYQPATKTFEYLLAGLPVIATQTYENKQVVNNSNGVLINDNPNEIAKAISYTYDNLSLFDEQTIRNSVKEFEWSRIIHTMKETLIN